jgi:hypothetical protein
MSPLLGSTGLVSYYSYRGNIDTLPNAFSLGANVTNAEKDVEIIRPVAPITGINYKAKVTPSSGSQISVNNGAYTSTSQYIRNNQSVSIKFTPTEYDTNYTVTLTVGKRSSSYTISTRSQPADSIPNPFLFDPQTNIDPPFKQNVESDTIITLSGMTSPSSGIRPEDRGTASISGNGAQFKVIRNGITVRNYGTGDSQVQNGDKIQLRMNASGNGQTATTTFSVTGTDNTNLASPITSTISGTWSITSKNYVASITLSANPNTVNYDNASTITWSSQNINTPITITNLGSFNNSGGSQSTGNLKAGASGGTITYTATANTLYPPPETVSSSVTVTVGAPPAPTVNLTAESNNIAYNTSTKLNWTSTNATSVNSSTDGFAGSNTNGTFTTPPLTQSKTYAIKVDGLEGQVSSESSVTITVQQEQEIVKYITANTTNVDVVTLFGSTDWTRDVRKRLVINVGVVVGSFNNNLAALIISAGVRGKFTLENRGSIQGSGGTGGGANGGNGGKGGNAIRVDPKGSDGTVTILNNDGSILAGGGGGGGGTKGGKGGTGGNGSYTVVENGANGGASTIAYFMGFIPVCVNDGGVASCLATVPSGYTSIGCAGNYASGNFCVCDYCLYSRTILDFSYGGEGGEGGNGGAGGVGRGYAQNSSNGSAGSAGSAGSPGGTNAGNGGTGGTGGTGGNGGGFGQSGNSGNQGETGQTGGDGNVTGGTGGIAADVLVGSPGNPGFSINGYSNVNEFSGNALVGSTNN